MSATDHWAIFVDNSSKKSYLIDLLLEGHPPTKLKAFGEKKGMLFSKLALEHFMDEEDRHGIKILTSGTVQSLQSMSSGERKKALLRHILKTDSDFIILDNPFDNLDRETQAELKLQLKKISERMTVVQLLSRKTDLLSFINNFARLDGYGLEIVEANKVRVGKQSASIDIEAQNKSERALNLKREIPPPVQSVNFEGEVLIELKSVNVSYDDKPILKNIDWTIGKGEFWELRGNNGSGKTTILSMITGENPKGYGQELYIFGRKKGSGESVWDIKKKIGYFTPAMTDKFRGYHSVEHMVISGMNDSIGLYVKPSEVQRRRAKEWLQLIGLWDVKDSIFHNLSTGQKRLVMCARAMIKHPPLLILDEPTAGLDDASADLFVALVNKFAEQSDTTVVFVSHRDEPGLEPDFIYELQMTEAGSLGKQFKEERN